MAMALQQNRKVRSPLNHAKLEEMALNYVGRFATSRARLVGYLARKLRERGWEGDDEAPVQELADRLVRLGYVDDRAYAMSKARSLTTRGYGQRRIQQALLQAGIGEEDSTGAHELATSAAYAAALRFARRKALGPFAAAKPDPRGRERALAAMIRAGHDFRLSRALVDLGPGEFPDTEEFSNLL